MWPACRKCMPPCTLNHSLPLPCPKCSFKVREEAMIFSAGAPFPASEWRQHGRHARGVTTACSTLPPAMAAKCMQCLAKTGALSPGPSTRLSFPVPHSWEFWPRGVKEGMRRSDWSCLSQERSAKRSEARHLALCLCLTPRQRPS